MRNPPSSSTFATSTTEASGGTKTTPCCSKVGLKRGPWTAEEDEILANFITREGEGKWRTLPKRAGLLRCGKSCRLRWMNYLRPCVKRGHIDPDEEDLILRLHRLLGNRWSLIAGRIPGRTDNEIKNYWNTHLSKKLISQGIDPRTHKPLSDVQISNSNNNNNNNNSTKPSTAPPNPNLMLPSNYNSEDSNSGVVVGSAADHTSPMAAEICFDLAGNNTFHNPNLNANQHLNFNDMITCGESRGSFEDQEDDPNYCTDEVFSSFLNSLINEDMFTSQGQQQLPRYDALLPQPTQSALAFGAPSWDATPPDDQPQ